MLKHHLLLPEHNTHHHAQFNHYLSLGAHRAPYTLETLAAFSVITLNPKEKLPEIQNNVGGGFSTAIVPLSGSLKIDASWFSCRPFEKQVVVFNPKNVRNEDENPSSFLYVAVRGEGIEKVKIELRRSEERSSVDLVNELLYVISGRASFVEAGSEIIIKNKLNFQQPTPLLYCIGQVRVTLQPGTLYLRLSDRT